MIKYFEWFNICVKIIELWMNFIISLNVMYNF